MIAPNPSGANIEKEGRARPPRCIVSVDKEECGTAFSGMAAHGEMYQDNEFSCDGRAR